MRARPDYRKESRALILRLRDEYGLTRFVETGVLHGRTTQWAAGQFEQVYAIELSELHFTRTNHRLRGIPNIHWTLGNSGEKLGGVLSLLPAPGILWIDAHWSPDLKYDLPEFGECPIMDEIDAINEDGRPHIVLIDDARHFLGRPPAPQHDEKWWPVYNDLQVALPNYTLSVEDDVIVGIPK